MLGKLSERVLEAFLEAVPIDFSILDGEDRVLAWNHHESRLFKRPEAVIGKDVRDCHPKKSLEKVERILGEMKEGKRDSARFWIGLKGRKILIEYFAIRDKEGSYLGCLEVTQDITEIQKLEGEKRLLD